MPDIYSVLLADAKDIANAMLQEARAAAAEREEIAKRLAQIENIERAAKPVPDRLGRLTEVLSRKDDPLCPRCFLEGRAASIMANIPSEDPDSFDAWKCRQCDHRTSVPTEDWGTPSGGFSAPV